MSASLCIELFSTPKIEKHDIVFLEADIWSPEVEKKLIGRMQELFAALRNLNVAVQISIAIETANIDEAYFLIKKISNKPAAIINPKLSTREIEVLGLIMQGFTNNEIAEKLFVCYETVKSHRKHILEKTGAKNTASLIAYYNQTFFEK
jgi:DNA-binding NarL/FixJ family response regulator